MPLPRRSLKPVDEARAATFMARLDALRRERPEAPVILVTAFSFGSNYLKLLHHLRKRGAIVALVTGDERINGATPIASLAGQGFFDIHWASNPYVLEMPYLASRYDFDLVHALVGTYSPYPFAELLRLCSAPVVADYIDFRELMYDDGVSVDLEAHKQAFGVQDAGLEFELWRRIFTGAAGVVYKDSPESLRHLSRRHGHTPRAIEFQSYVCPEWMPPEALRPRDGTPSRAVFAGGLQCDPAQHDFKTCRTTLDVALSLARQGFHFTVYNACDNGLGGFEAFRELADANERFAYHPAVPNHLLARALSAHDLGWNYQHFEQGSETAFCHARVMSSKIFNFLEAGLPVVASRYTAYVASYLEAHDIGLGVESRDIGDFAALVRETDWDRLHAGVARARDTLSMDRHFPRLLDLYNHVTGKTLFAGTPGDITPDGNPALRAQAQGEPDA
ncbi:hypothetical protein NNJEOMEG_02778 [Fundidesulfovibrio magnetotacticus]|uniref:Glycosyltransferase n=1 Tax=Fundidesulfovibrio magnetotacticus TaxID=2730080 RepID=A0A6V8LVF7_9BACT|nr:hypothetical protein [Fundidesulfovibrio magnetotacticus]GFK94930.1 hypothetical protein NNJEOMEG_02778 [Fundidesulfovibrio magnetotacticus]